MPEKKANQKLNPEIVEIEIGVRYLRKVTFYPLSVAHQLKMTDILEAVFQELVGVSQGEDESVAIFIGKVLEIIKENINRIVIMIAEEDPDAILNDMTNPQLVKVIEYVYTTNFEGPLKNLLNLFQKEGEENKWSELISSQLSPLSAKPMDIDLNISTGEVSGMEGSLTDK